MRTARGGIAFTFDRDRPLLRLVWEVEIATSGQLFALRQLASPEVERSKAAFFNRLHRLEKEELIAAESIYAPALTTGYRITSKGILRLLGWGLVPEDYLEESATASVPECIYLNAMRIRFWNQQSADRWISRRELMARKQCFERPDDDFEFSARISLAGNWGKVQIGIVYAVPSRSLSNYALLREKWTAARTVNWIVCIVCSEQQAVWLAQKLQPCTIHIFFTSRDDFASHTLECRAYRLGNAESSSLKNLILQNLQPSLGF